ncbi:DNA-directed RNA polymerase III subunit rpc9 [Lachnellula suecica]|uniref:DNA-directed RNA polymerase III subunit RPC9 n=1 Tax=Lachnellula suecica TaxID=602035 RepID=A0A8T9BQJ1_9HELO|nr:DNA-directed RNA polymerase III subunit rpc9 [Lachnellula suecica]
MKIIEAQSATLTNYEVFKHLQDQGDRYEAIKQFEIKDKKSKGEKPEQNVIKRPGNLWTLRKELMDYFKEPPSPLAYDKLPYNDDTITNLLKELRSWEITKGEVIMMLNLRPTKLENLNTIIQEMEERFTEEEQNAILAAIVKVLGRPDGEFEREKMEENAHADKVRDMEEQKTLELVDDDEL